MLRRCRRRLPVESLESRRLLAATLAGGVWDVFGDADRRSPADVIAIAPAAQDPSSLRVMINGSDAGTAPVADVREIRINAGRGNDVVTIDLGTAGQGISVTALGGHGDDRITGAGEADSFFGGPGHDRLDGGGGNDSLAGDGGDDDLAGGDGDDSARGGAGNDVLAGGWGSDSLAGDRGHDNVRGGAGDDRLDGGAGNDRLIGGDGADTLAGGRGADQNFQQDGVDTLAAPIGARPNVPAIDKRDTVSADNVTAPATRQQDDEQLKQWLIDAAVKQWQWAFDQPANPWGYYYGGDGEILIGRDVAPPPPPGVPPPPTPTPTPGPTPTPSPGIPVNGGAVSNPPPGTDTDSGGESGGPGAAPGDDHSDTNTQESGVDEADLVETDGRFLYTLNESNLVIVSAVPADGMSVVSRTAFDASPVGIYLHGTRLTVVSAEFSWRIDPLPVPLPVERGTGAPVAVDVIAPPPEPPKAEVHVTVFDVSNPAAPAQVEKTSMEGMYGGSRLVGERLYIVISNDTWVPPPQIIPGPTEPTPTPTPTDPPGIDDPVTGMIAPTPTPVPGLWRPDGLPGGVYESEASYRARLEALPLGELVPGYTSTAVAGDSSGLLVRSSDAYVRDLGEPSVGQNLTTVALLNLGDTSGGPTATSTVAGFGGEVYASADALYLAGAQWDNTVAGEQTRLLKFQLAPDAVPLAATGTVGGHVIDQFSMDEEADTFRVATTGFIAEPDDPGAATLTNNLYVLEQSGDELNVIGSLTHLKDGETLRSARFVGDRAYLVTFRQVDPLFSISLADPTNPRVTGELTIPGFSSYLQPISDDLLLGIGRDIDPDTNADQGVQLSLFDVSDPANPRRVDAIHLSDRWESSEAEFDHHAFAYFSDQQILAVPVSHFSMDGTADASLVVIKIDASLGDGALQKLGEPTIEGGVRRSVRITDVLYAVGNDRVEAVELASPETTVGSVSLKP